MRLDTAAAPVSDLRFGLRLRVFLRSFAIQGSWNYRTLVGTGFAFALLPVLRRVYGDNAAALRSAVDRQAGLFNTHPYLSGIALGAVARLEAEGASPELIERFKAALRGSLGTLGDRLVWAGWRPACMLFAILLLLLGAPWYVAVGTFLLAYNAGHFVLRWWALHTGLNAGRNVAERVREAGLEPLRDRIAAGATFLLGATLPLLAVRGVTGDPIRPATAVLAGLAAILGLRFGMVTRRPAIAGLALILALGFLLGLAP
jgi:mannose/fructose/N-acetylgalactosamine-specific phosphotransferase system component IID